MPLVVIDTNVLVSAALSPRSAPGQVFQAVLQCGHFAVCEQSLAELELVLARDKFDRFVTQRQRMALLELVKASGVLCLIEPGHFEAAHGTCRDPDDGLFLALALAAQARTIISGDADLLVLHPWQGIQICTAAQYLGRARQAAPTG